MFRLQKDSGFWKLVQISSLKFQSLLSSVHVDQISNEGGVVAQPVEMWRTTAAITPYYLYPHILTQWVANVWSGIKKHIHAIDML